jgi:hypothetical protein
MKIFGYVDDGISLFINWQISLGLLNILIIPLEIIIIIWIIFKCKTKHRFAG